MWCVQFLPSVCKTGQDGEYWLQLADFEEEEMRAREKKNFYNCKVAAHFMETSDIWYHPHAFALRLPVLTQVYQARRRVMESEDDGCDDATH